MTDPSQTKLLVATSPYTHEPVCKIPFETDATLSVSVEQARAAQSAWKEKPLAERIRVIESGLDKLRLAQDSVTRDVSLQMGKPITQSQAELTTLFDRARAMIGLAPTALQPDQLSPREGFVRRIEHEPLGIVLNIAAWNYPLIIPINVIVPALLAGNTVLLKHSGRTPLTGQVFEDAFGGLEVRHLVTNLVLSHDQTSALIESGMVDHVAFTGSVAGGRRVYQSAAHQLLTAGMELGGNDAAYVAADADLEFAVSNIVDGACYNAGQSCCAIERVYVHRDLYHAFLDRTREALAACRMGDPLEAGTTLGPLATRTGLTTLARHVGDAVRRGAELLAGGERGDDTAGNFFAPTLLAGCPQDSLVMQEESFGPLLPVAPVADDEMAVRLMNDSCYGLTASVWTGDLERAERMGRRLEAGTVYQNRCDYLDPELPWTGWKHSGFGSTLSHYGFYHLTHRKSIHFRAVT